MLPTFPLLLLPSHVICVMLLLSSLHPIAGFISYASIPSVVGVPAVVGGHVVAVTLAVAYFCRHCHAVCVTAACVTVKAC